MHSVGNIDSKNRFSDRVDEYAKYRPGYPGSIISFLTEKHSLTPESSIADVGSGTGISSKLFLDLGCQVFGVEPNKEMRDRSKAELQSFEKFIAVDGSAHGTTLPSHSVDFVVVAQALHWFDLKLCKIEFSRILKPNGKVIVLYNQRDEAVSGLAKDYKSLLEKYGRDYKELRHRKHDELVQDNFFKSFEVKVFSNNQDLNFEGLLGRVQSSSYMPVKGEEKFDLLMSELKSIFDEHNQNGSIRFSYNTHVYVGEI